MIEIGKHIEGIEPYKPGKPLEELERELGIKNAIKLASNENPLGPSKKALTVLKKSLAGLHRYPEGSGRRLREAIAQKHKLKSDQVILGNGSDEIMDLAAKTFLEPGDEAILGDQTFSIYQITVAAHHGVGIRVPLRDGRFDLEAIGARVTPLTRLVFICNPNNPTGTYVPFDQVKRLQNSLPAHVLLVLDAAYAEYVQRNDYESGIELVATTDNVVMTRTFSKIYGLAALRLGWLYGPAHVVDAVNRIRGPFNVNGPAIAAGVAAIRDTAHVEHAREHNARWLAWLTEEIGRLGLPVTPSVANFVLIHFPQDPGRTAKDADAFLTKRGLILRQVGAYKLPHALRMSVGTEEANRLAVQALKDFLGTAA